MRISHSFAWVRMVGGVLSILLFVTLATAAAPTQAATPAPPLPQTVGDRCKIPTPPQPWQSQVSASMYCSQNTWISSITLKQAFGSSNNYVADVAVHEWSFSPFLATANQTYQFRVDDTSCYPRGWIYQWTYFVITYLDGSTAVTVANNSANLIREYSPNVQC